MRLLRRSRGVIKKAASEAIQFALQTEVWSICFSIRYTDTSQDPLEMLVSIPLGGDENVHFAFNLRDAVSEVIEDCGEEGLRQVAAGLRDLAQLLDDAAQKSREAV